VTGKRNNEVREVPMIPDMRRLPERLLCERGDEAPDAPVMRVRECQKAMDRAARVIGMSRITHHDLRHPVRNPVNRSWRRLRSGWIGFGLGVCASFYGVVRLCHRCVRMAKISK